MSTRNLEHMFQPRAIAVIGNETLSEDRYLRLLHNLLAGPAPGPVMPVLAGHESVAGMLAYPEVGALPRAPDLAVLCKPLSGAGAIVDALGRLGCRAVLLLDDACARPGAAPDADAIRAVLEAARPYTLRVLGPDALGFALPATGLNASLLARAPARGHVAVLSHSAAMLRVIVDWALERDLGFSHVMSLGNRSDVDFADMLDHLAQDARTRAILLYVEGIHKPRKFLSAARIAARIKPVVVLRPRDPCLEADEDAIYDAAFRRAGLLRVENLEQLTRSVETLSTARPAYQDRLAILANSRSLGLLAVESLLAHGGQLAALQPQTRERLIGLAAGLDPQGAVVDLGDHAGPEAFGQGLTALLADGGNDAVLVAHAATGMEEDVAVARVLAPLAARSDRLVLAAWAGGTLAGEAARIFRAERIACFDNPGEAARVFTRIVRHTRNMEMLAATPPSLPEVFTPDTGAARKLIARALAQGREALTPLEAARLLGAYGIDMVPARQARDARAAAHAAERIGYPVVLKVLSPDVPRKTDVGGVRSGLESAQMVREAARRMLRRVRKLAPDARLDGFVVQPMMVRGGAWELRVSMHPSPGFGPVLGFGHGGTEAEAIQDLAYALPPLNVKLARELIAGTRISRLLETSPARHVDMDRLALMLIKVAQMIVDLGEITSLAIDPLWVDANRVLAMDARVRIAPSPPGAAIARLAIRPYPRELEEMLTLRDGRRVLLRPIVPEDEPALQDMVRRTPPEDLRLRFFQPIRELSHAMAARLTQLDYDREMALAVTEPGVPGRAPIHAVVRMILHPSLEQAEYAIIVTREMGGQGLGTGLMKRIIDYARSRGVAELYGEVLRENHAMLHLATKLGFQTSPEGADPAVIRVTLPLSGR